MKLRQSKKLLAMLLAAAMSATMLPTVSLAADPVSGEDISSTGKDFSSGTPTVETVYKAGEGTVTYTPAADGTPATVTLNNATVSVSASVGSGVERNALKFNGNTVVKIEGNNSVSINGNYTGSTILGSTAYIRAMYFSGTSTIDSDTDGKLTVNATSSSSKVYGYGIHTVNTLDVEGGFVTAKGKTAAVSGPIAEGVTVSSSSAVATNKTLQRLYSITVEDAENGSVSVDKTSLRKGQEAALTVEPAEGYELDTLTVMNGETPVEVKDNKFTMPAGNVTVSAEFVKHPYTITVEDSENGTVTAPETAAAGDNVALDIVPASDYVIDKIYVNDQEIEEPEFIMPEQDVTVKVTFKAMLHTVKIAEMTNGTVETDKAEAATGETVTLTPKANSGYVLKELTVSGDDPVEVTKQDDGTYTFTMPKFRLGVEVTATFEAVDHAVTAEAANGKIDAPEGAKTDETIEFTVKANDGYAIDKVTVKQGDAEAEEVTADTETGKYSYTVKAEGDVVISASFNKIPYNVTVAEGIENGTVSVGETTTAAIGDEVAVEVTPAKGYELDTLTANGEDIKEAKKFTMPAKDVEINATFKAIEYKVTVANIENGTVTPDKTTATIGQEVTLTVEEAEGYELDTLTANGEDIKEAKKFTMQAEDVEINATFKAIDYTVTVAESENGTVSADKATATIGEEVALTVEPAEGYELDTLTVQGDDNDVEVKDNKFVMPAGNVTVSATFKEKEYKVSVAEDMTGGIIESSVKAAKKGTRVELTVTPAEGYEIDGSVYYLDKEGLTNIADKTTDGKYDFTMPDCDVVVKADFKLTKYDITVVKPEYGTIRASESKATMGTEVTLTATADPGYVLDKFTVMNGETPVEVKDNKFTMPAGDVTVKATFKAVEVPVAEYKITVEASDNGTVAADKEAAKAGEEVALTVTPAEGYELDTLTVMNGETPVEVKDNKFTMPEADVTVKATFKAVEVPVVEYKITVEASDNGTVAADKEAAKAGEEVALTVTPAEGYELDTLTVMNGETPVEVKDNKFTMPEADVTVKATFKKTEQPSKWNEDFTSCDKNDNCPLHKFSDLNANEWYHDGIQFTLDNGLMQGTDKGFEPSLTTSRAMITVMLWRLEGQPTASYDMTFKDVAADQWYTEAIRWAQSVGVVTGYDADTFGTNDPMTREQAITVLYRYAKYKGYDVSAAADLSKFADAAKVSSYAADSVQWAVGTGLVVGNAQDDGSIVLDPQGSSTRAQVATMIERYCTNILK